MKRNSKFEQIIVDNIRFRRYYESVRREDRIYFKGYYNKKRVTLHRYLWEKINGSIPKGFVVHHINNNPLDNRIDNLQCVSRSEHQSNHLKEPERIEKSRLTIKIAREFANKWHGSPEGLKFHKKLGKISWKKKIKKEKKCLNCFKQYKTYFPSRSKFCSTKCKSKFRYTHTH